MAISGGWRYVTMLIVATSALQGCYYDEYQSAKAALDEARKAEQAAKRELDNEKKAIHRIYNE